MRTLFLALSVLSCVGQVEGGPDAATGGGSGGASGGSISGGSAGGSIAGGSAGGATSGGASGTSDGGTILGTDAGVWDGGFPYVIPTAGSALFIGTNTADAVRPAPLSAGDWEYALFNCYAGGVYVRDVSPGGAYVLAATGGHNCPPNVGAALFDFTDATWKRIDNTNGVPWRTGDYGPSEVNSELELSIAGATPNAVPAPFHTYQLLAELPTARGGGPRGSVITVITQFGTTSANSNSRSHRFDLATGAWSRLSTNAAGLTGFTAIRDAVANRIYLLPSEIHAVHELSWLDGADWTWKTTSFSGWPATDGNNNTSFIEPNAHVLVMLSSTQHLRAIELDAVATGVHQLNVTGTLPTFNNTRWERDPSTGAFYTYSGSGQTLYKLTPPATNPLTNPWIVSTLGVTGLTMPAHPTTGNGTSHYTRFFYVPPLDCFAWIGNSGSRVVLLKPPP